MHILLDIMLSTILLEQSLFLNNCKSSVQEHFLQQSINMYDALGSINSN